ncbi:MAG: hypothetical protein C0506_02755 [Anaerolinea sp.]|nr:hypothetical protein [Anaerolinea sp.]
MGVLEMGASPAHAVAMTTLADLRTRIRKDLHDTDSANYRWTDSQLDRHIQRALDETSRAMPNESAVTMTATAGSRDLSLASIMGLMDVEAAEFPVGQFPPSYAPFSRWANTLSLHLDEPPPAEPVKLYCTVQHTLDGSGTTLAGFQEDIVATGAAAYAVLDSAANAIDRLATGGPEVPAQFLAWARAREIAYKQLLIQHGRRNRVRVRRTFLPAS